MQQSVKPAPSLSSLLPFACPKMYCPPSELHGLTCGVCDLQAYADYNDMMEITENVIRACAEEVCSSLQVRSEPALLGDGAVARNRGAMDAGRDAGQACERGGIHSHGNGC